jgi:hypothetical protein
MLQILLVSPWTCNKTRLLSVGLQQKIVFERSSGMEFTDTIELAIVFFAISFVIKSILDYSMKKKLIDKGLVDENVKHLFKYSGPANGSLKWGMVLVAVGGAVIIGRLAPYSWSDEATVSSMFILAGLALIVYYAISPKIGRGSEKNTPAE